MKKSIDYEESLPKDPWWEKIILWILFIFGGWIIIKILIFIARRQERDGDTWLIDWW